jgi:hypothetical protein
VNSKRQKRPKLRLAERRRMKSNPVDTSIPEPPTNGDDLGGGLKRFDYGKIPDEIWRRLRRWRRRPRGEPR